MQKFNLTFMEAIFRKIKAEKVFDKIEATK